MNNCPKGCSEPQKCFDCVASSPAGVKFDGDKPPMELLSPYAMFSLARLLGRGAKKYAPRNWEKGMAWTRPLAAILRHSFALLMGERIDAETGEPHATCIMCEAMFLVHYYYTKSGTDDLPMEIFAKEAK